MSVSHVGDVHVVDLGDVENRRSVEVMALLLGEPTVAAVTGRRFDAEAALAQHTATLVS